MTNQEIAKYVEDYIKKCDITIAPVGNYYVRIRSLEHGTEVNKVITGDTPEEFYKNIYDFITDPVLVKKDFENWKEVLGKIDCCSGCHCDHLDTKGEELVPYIESLLYAQRNILLEQISKLEPKVSLFRDGGKITNQIYAMLLEDVKQLFANQNKDEL